MSDIDFDELDKAVNSLMQPSGDDNLPAQDKSKTTPDKAVIDNHGVGMDDSPTDDIEAQTPKSDPRPPAPASLAVKRRGQFMDMIHPSADMKTKTAPAGSLSRKGLAVQPRNDFEANEPISGNFTQTAANTVGAEVSMTAAGTTYVDAEPDTTFTSDVTDAEESPMTDWPDPLDVEDQSETEEPLSELSDLSDSSDVNDTLDGLIDEDDQAGYEVSDTTQPSYPDPIDSMSSPFLPDAKVEKRPLGPVKTKDADQESSENVIDEESTDTEVSEVHGDSEPAPIDIPEELHASLMSLEGRDVVATDDSSSQASDVTPPANPSGAAPPSVTTTSVATHQSMPPEPLATPSVSETSASSRSSAPAALSSSLPPHTPASSTDDDGDDDAISSIFDTDDSALKHRPQHSSGWYTIIVFAGMVIVGVLGAVVYYYMTNNGF